MSGWFGNRSPTGGSRGGFGRLSSSGINFTDTVPYDALSGDNVANTGM